MKKILFIFCILALTPIFFQCDSIDDLVTDGAKEGGLVELTNPSLNYVVGNTSSYSFSMLVYQAEMKVTKLYFYKSFFSNADTAWSNEVLETTINVTNNLTHTITSPGYFYADLINGLTVDGNALPAADGELTIGDFFSFRVVSELSDGRQMQMGDQVKLTVSTRFAGKYRFVEGVYWRLGVLMNTGSYWANPYWEFQSIDAKTYKMIGLSAWDDNVLYFQIEADNTITYPAEWDGVAQSLNDFDLITCAANGALLTNVNCGASNYVVKDDVGGKDRLYMSFGYNSAGPREFYQVMEKIVE